MNWTASKSRRSTKRRGFALVLTLFGAGADRRPVVHARHRSDQQRARSLHGGLVGGCLLPGGDRGWVCAKSDRPAHGDNWPGTGTGGFTFTYKDPVSLQTVTRGTCYIKVTPSISLSGNGAQQAAVAGEANRSAGDLEGYGQRGHAFRAERTMAALFRQFSSYGNGYATQQEMADDYWITGNSFTGPAHTNGHWNFWGNPSFTQATSSSLEDWNQQLNNNNNLPFNSTTQVLDTTKIPAPDTGAVQINTPSKFYESYGGNYTTTYPVPATGATQFSFDGYTRPVQQATNQSATVIANAAANGNGTAFDGTKGGHRHHLQFERDGHRSAGDAPEGRQRQWRRPLLAGSTYHDNYQHAGEIGVTARTHLV